VKRKFKTTIKYLIGSEKGVESLSKINIPSQFHPDAGDTASIARNLNSAFLIVLSGKSHALYNESLQYLNALQIHPAWEKAVRFYKDGLRIIDSEISDRCYTDSSFAEKLNHLHSWIVDPENRRKRSETVEKIRELFFPEGVSLSDRQNRQGKINFLRENRKIKITKLNSSPIRNPANEILFTSNILVTIPLASMDINNLPVSVSLRQKLGQIVQEEQLYWYDHPIPIGIDPRKNEILYGLTGLEEAMKYEIEKGTVGDKSKLTCVLSVSVTHKGLQGIIKEHLAEELRNERKFRHIDVYAFTEVDTTKLIDEILVPIADKYAGMKETRSLCEIFGVDGEYGRHYSFLKAISAFWRVFIDPEIKATFKIDLDQVFPQKKLVEECGASVLDHFKSPLWGAEGIDNQGNKVELGMIAGALVNKEDIDHSLFYPDVSFPPDEVQADELVFLSRLPQALSTEVEMMARYTSDILNGRNQVIQRVHVTGGTTGILIDALRKYRPFTPTFIGRAEDQAYILSVLFSGSPYLRYLHKAGLIMRHDKKAFAGEAIKAAALGKMIGDYIRVLHFSYYVNALPWSFKDIKNVIDPFTGCFVAKIPLTVVYLRFALKLASIFIENSTEKNQEGIEFLKLGTKRLHDTIQKITKQPNPLIEQYQKEKESWNLFYDILDIAEKRLKKNDAFTLELQKNAIALVEACKIDF